MGVPSIEVGLQSSRRANGSLNHVRVLNWIRVPEKTPETFLRQRGTD